MAPQQAEVLALITQPQDVDVVLPWAAQFALARDATLTVICWSYALVAPARPAQQSFLEHTVQRVIDAEAQKGPLQTLRAAGQLTVFTRTHRKPWIVAVQYARTSPVQLIVAAAEDLTGHSGATYASSSLLRNSPCHTMVLFGGKRRSSHAGRLFVGVTDSFHDSAAFFLASRLVGHSDATVTLARMEMDFESEAFEVGHRELRRLMRDAGVESTDKISCEVFSANESSLIGEKMDEHDLVLIAANSRYVPTVLAMTLRPTVAVLKRSPPLRPWRSKRAKDLGPRLSPADYSDLIEALRRGSRLSADFFIMLCLASVVASMGLLQDSPAVVIGSMLLAPLMTPMLGCGLALAQANPKLGNMALRVVVLGLVCTLALSYGLGLITPGAELTPQILARGEPTVLDMVVALAAAVAAAYALARPDLVSSIAGVAIATALVPPLCSVGLALAYGNAVTAQGAALLFTTNFVAIVLAAAVTFRAMGVTAERADARQRRWVLRTAIVLAMAAMILYVPLQQALLHSLVLAKPQPRTYPLASSVAKPLERAVRRQSDIELIVAGRPASPEADEDVVLVLGANEVADCAFSKKLIRLLRRQMDDSRLRVRVHCLKTLR